MGELAQNIWVMTYIRGKELRMKARFEVSTEGMKGLHDGRPLWSLVKELVANAWDEETTLCKVTIDGHEEVYEGGEVKGIIKVAVEDDGGGFSDIADSYTLMAPTSKRQEAGVRGRFNIGEKEILSVALEGKVETVGTTIDFPREGGRVVTKNKRKKGTIVSAIVERPLSEVGETVKALLEFLPPAHITYSVNGEVVTPRKKVGVANGILHTVLATGIGQPLRYSYRKTDIDIYEPHNGEGHIYEMGITIQPLDFPYDVDVQQKVPMPPNRDTVTARYLQDIYSHVLSVVADDLDQSEASESWVQMGVEDEATPDSVVEKVMRVKLGENAVLWSNDVQANEMAHNAGMDLIKPRTLSKLERERFRAVGLTTATQGYGVKPDGEMKVLNDNDITTEMHLVGDYAEWLCGQLLGFPCKVRFIRLKAKGKQKRLAQYGSRTLDFVVDALGQDWFQMTNGSPSWEHTSLIIHELAHEGEKDHLPHTGEYVHRLANLGARATHLAIYLYDHADRGGWWRASDD
jgi:hypothetical protein